MKRFVSFGVALLMVFSLFCVAFASTRETTMAGSTSVTKTCPVDKCKYTALTWVLVDPDDRDDGSYVGATMNVYSTDYNGRNVPAGYMGSNTRLYLNNVLRNSSGWTYNSGKGNAMGGSTGVFDVFLSPRKGIVYSQSKFALYNGNGYNEYDTNRSPSLDVSQIFPSYARAAVVDPIPGEIEVNDAGQTYGSGCLSPDLIEAIGIDGVHGYVLAEELDAVGRKSSPDDIVEIPETIPLYAEDGVTVIGAFKISSVQVSEFSIGD